MAILVWFRRDLRDFDHVGKRILLAENKDQCFDAGINDFLTKPEILYATLLKWFEQHRG